MERALGWSIDSETGVLRDVLLCRPDFYQWIETNAIAVETLGSGRRADLQAVQSQFRQLEDALEQAGVTRHYIEPEPHLHYQVYTRDSSQTTPWGPLLTQLPWPEGRVLALCQPWRRRGRRHPHHPARTAADRPFRHPHHASGG
jgi:arginine deiminase